VFKVSSLIQGVEIKPLSESAVAVYFGNEITLHIHQKVRALSTYLEEKPFSGLVEWIPAFTSVTVFFDPAKIRLESGNPSTFVCSILRKILLDLQVQQTKRAREVTIPVCYGGEFGPDIEIVAEYNQLSVEEVIQIHSTGEYIVYMLGFAPGFPYLGGLSDQLATPRKKNPRLEIPPGAVGIGGAQTGVYTISTPGGWQLIGQTPVPLFLPDEDPPSYLQAGDIVRFQPISAREYAAYKEGEKWL
jgi:inhibitor of KinA